MLPLRRRPLFVASFMDAWIEIPETALNGFVRDVASFMDAWIEIAKFHPTFRQSDVASFMDAWIEINYRRRIKRRCCVASFMDAWIEIMNHSRSFVSIASHPLWMRGLKCILLRLLHVKVRGVASFMDAWIEIVLMIFMGVAIFCRILYGCVD